MPKISVIIPVYNVEKYLPQALESVMNQTFSDLEIICVNDGSTDNSLKILEEYAQKDERIIVFTQVNQGVSSARNKGIDNATGEYIMFLDPDDTYDLTLCEKVVHKIDAENPDIVMWGHNNVSEDKIIQHNEQLLPISILQNKKNPTLFDFMQIQIWVWDKAFKKDFLYQYDIRFCEGVTTAEDVIFCIETFLENPKYSFINESLVQYTVYRNDSALSKAKPNIIKKEFETYKNFILSEKISKQSINIKLAITERFLCGTIYYWKTLDNEIYREQYLKDIKEFITYLKDTYSFFELIKMKKYLKLQLMLCKYLYKSVFQLFDIQTTKTEKTFVFLGRNLTIKRKINRNILQTNHKYNRINIVLLLDEKYFFCTYVAIISMIKNKDKSSIYKLFLLTKDLSTINLDKLKAISTDNFEIEVIDVSGYGDKYNNIVDVYHISNTALIKFDIPNILSSLNKVLYLDGDILVNKDLTELFNTDIEHNYLGAVREIRAENNRYQDLTGTKYYFNSGVMLLNLKKMRDENISSKLIQKKLNQPKTWKCMDQDVFNNVIADNFKILPLEFNNIISIFLSSNINLSQINEFYSTKYYSFKALNKNSTILHFAGELKPWIYNLGCLSKIYKKYSKTKLKLKKYKGENTFLQNLFSIRNAKNREGKIVTVLWQKFSIKNNKWRMQ